MNTFMHGTSFFSFHFFNFFFQINHIYYFTSLHGLQDVENHCTWEISSWRQVEKFHISAVPMYYSLCNWIGEHEITKRKKIAANPEKRTQKQAQKDMNEMEWHKIWYFQQCACVNAIYFAPVVSTRAQQGVWALKWLSLPERVRNC